MRRKSGLSITCRPCRLEKTVDETPGLTDLVDTLYLVDTPRLGRAAGDR
jgi:hypothetical protein